MRAFVLAFTYCFGFLEIVLTFPFSISTCICVCVSSLSESCGMVLVHLLQSFLPNLLEVPKDADSFLIIPISGQVMFKTYLIPAFYACPFRC